MTAPTTYAGHVATGATGASHPLTSSESTDILAGQPLWLSCFYKATRTTGSGILTLRCEVLWWNAAGTPLTSTFFDTSINATVDWTFKEDKHTAPATAVKCAAKFTLTPAASPMQHNVWIAKVRLGRTQVAADITAVVDGVTTAEFAHSAVGVAESGQFPRNLAYKLLNATGTVAAGITWTYLVKTGTVNGFTSASGAQSISGAGAVSFPVSSMGTNTADVEIKAVYNGASYVKTISLTKTFAAPDTGGGGGGSSGSSQSSGFGDVTSSWTTISNVLTATLGPSATQADISINLSAMPIAVSPNGANNVEFKVQKDIASVWTDEGAAQNSAPDAIVAQDLETLEYYVVGEGTMVATINDTGLTSSASYDYRVQARYTTGSANHAPLSLTGSIVVSVP